MKLKYYGSIEDLKWLVVSATISGDWEQQGDKWVFRSSRGGILNWWPSSGTVHFQGKDPGKSQLQEALGKSLTSTAYDSAGRPTMGSIHPPVATDAVGCSEPSALQSHGQDNAISFKVDLSALLKDLADVCAKQRLILMVVNGVPRIVQEQATTVPRLA